MKENKRQKMTLLLDDETIKALREFGYREIGATNVSKAVMLMVKEYENRIGKTSHEVRGEQGL